MIISVEKGSYGHWIVTADIGGYFISKQYYFCLKREAVSMAKKGTKNEF